MQVPDDLGGKGTCLNLKIVYGGDSNQTIDQELTEKGGAKCPKARTRETAISEVLPEKRG